MVGDVQWENYVAQSNYLEGSFCWVQQRDLHLEMSGHPKPSEIPSLLHL